LNLGFQVTRERTIRGEKAVETVYGIASLSGERASPEALLARTRDHWKIENRLHYVRDVTPKEDACRMRSGSAPQVLAALRNAVVHRLADVTAKSRPEAIELLPIYPGMAHELIGILQCDE